MKLHEEIDIRILVDRLRLLKDGMEQLNKPYSQWTTLEIWQYAFPTLTYARELLTLLDKDNDTDIRHRNDNICEGESL